MTSIRSQETQQLRRSGLQQLVTLGLLVAVAIGATFAITSGILDNADSMSGTNRIAIVSVNAYTDGDRMVVSGNIQNLGSQPLTSVTIDEITAGDLVITQLANIEDGQIAAGHGDMSLAGLDDGGAAITFADVESDLTPAAGTTESVWTGPGSDDRFEFGTATHGAATVSVTGFSTDDDELESLSAGSSKSFRIVITGISAGGSADILDILRTVPASSELFITVAGTDGSTSTISDPRSVRVQAR